VLGCRIWRFPQHAARALTFRRKYQNGTTPSEVFGSGVLLLRTEEFARVRKYDRNSATALQLRDYCASSLRKAPLLANQAVPIARSHLEPKQPDFGTHALQDRSVNNTPSANPDGEHIAILKYICNISHRLRSQHLVATKGERVCFPVMGSDAQVLDIFDEL